MPLLRYTKRNTLEAVYSNGTIKKLGTSFITEFPYDGELLSMKEIAKRLEVTKCLPFDDSIRDSVDNDLLEKLNDGFCRARAFDTSFLSPQ